MLRLNVWVPGIQTQSLVIDTSDTGEWFQKKLQNLEAFNASDGNVRWKEARAASREEKTLQQQLKDTTIIFKK